MSLPKHDLSVGRRHLKALHRNGYHVAVNSVMQGLTRVVDLHDENDWQCLREEIRTWKRSAWYGTNVGSLLTSPSVASFCVSYRHVSGGRSARPSNLPGATMNGAQWQRLRDSLMSFAKVYNSSKFVLWIDQILHCSSSMDVNANWVTKGVLPYMLLPVLYVGGPDEGADEEHQWRLWVAVERACALTNAGIHMHGHSQDECSRIGASLSLGQALKWLSGRIIGGTFNGCALSWAEDYLSFRDLSVQIVKAEDGISAVESFLNSPDKVKGIQISVMDAFIFSSDSQNMSFGGVGHEYHGTYLASRLTRGTEKDGSWHGLREWVQYTWIDGTLKDASNDEFQQIVELSRWSIFRDLNSKNGRFGLGLVSAEGEVGAMGVVHLEEAKLLHEGRVLWFQRGLSPLARQYARQLFHGMRPTSALIAEVSQHWGIKAGEALGVVKGSQVQWRWKHS